MWVERTGDGARLLEVRADPDNGDQLSGELPTPSADGTALLVTVTGKGGKTVVNSCSIATAECRVLADQLDAQSAGRLSLPDNWGRQQGW